MSESIHLLILIPVCVVFLCAVIVLIRSLIEPYLLDISTEQLSVYTTHSISNPKTLLKIAFFSDLHDNGCKVDENKLINGLLFEHPDLIIFGGDLCQHNKIPQKGLHILQMISDSARQYNIPCYAVRGNHDTQISAQIFRAVGFELLDDEYFTFKTNDDVDFCFIGFNDSGKSPRVWSKMPRHLPEDRKPEYTVAISHNPDIVYHYNYSDFGFLLSGHLHGGQIFLPFRLEHRLLRSDRMPKEGIVKGRYEKNGIEGYISRGCGCVIFPLRLLSKPQITHIHITE